MRIGASKPTMGTGHPNSTDWCNNIAQFLLVIWTNSYVAQMEMVNRCLS